MIWGVNLPRVRASCYPSFIMLDWSELAGLRVIGRMAEMINQRWNLGVGFADERGRLIDTPTIQRYATVRPFCDLLRRTPEGRRRCDAVAQQMIEHHRAGAEKPGPACMSCHAGLFEPYVPVSMDGQFEGLLLAGGFLREETREAQSLEVLARCADLSIPKDDLRRALERTPVLSSEGERLLQDLLELVVNEILIFREEVTRKERRLDRLTRELAERSEYGQLIGKSPAMRSLYRTLDKVAASDSSVLILGENGTGKELVARALHFHSDRKDKPFIVQNCSAFNDNLLDSELFGHARGAFTGAVGTKKGLFEVADGGTFFLDEIGDMSPTLQVKLLRVLQEGTFIPVGSTQTRKVDVRIIAATNRDLKSMVDQGLYREDLYYRINVVTLSLPPLRDRLEDLPMLVDHFLARHGPESKTRLSSDCLDRMMDFNWPGNVRELENEIERLLVLQGDSEVIGEEFLSSRIRYEIYPGGAAPGGPREQAPSLHEAVERLERTMILDHLKRSRWNKTKAADSLGISRRNLIRKVQAFDLDRRKNR